MIQPQTIRLYCSQCEPARWHVLLVSDVAVSLDLSSDSYHFDAECPECGQYIHNTRGVYHP